MLFNDGKRYGPWVLVDLMEGIHTSLQDFFFSGARVMSYSAHTLFGRKWE